MIEKEVEKVQEQIDIIFNIFNTFTSKEELDKIIKSNNVNYVEKSIDALKLYLLEEIRKVIQEIDRVKYQLRLVDESLVKLNDQKADKHLVNENIEELKKLTFQETESLKIQLNNLDANLIKLNDQKADADYVNENFAELKKH